MNTWKTSSRPSRRLMMLAIAICAGLLLGLITLDITYVTGQAASNRPDEAGYAPQGQSTLGNFVWYDTDWDGAQDPTELGIDQVLVKLYMDDGNGNFSFVSQMYTGDNPASPTVEAGWYQFLIGTTPGYYWVVVDVSNFAPAGPLEGDLHTSISTYGPNPLIVYFPAGISNNNNADFGFAEGLRLGDFAWLDDGDGIQEPGETTGVANVPIHVTGEDILGNLIDITVPTSGTGYYIVDNLRPGTYTVTAPNVSDSLTLSSPGTLTVTLTGDVSEDLTLDFGYTRPTALQLVNFNISRGASASELSWEITLLEGTVRAPGFHVYRAVPDGAWKRLTPEPLAPVSQNSVQIVYDFTDDLVESGQRYLYQLRSTDGETFGPWQTDLPAAAHHFYLPFVRR